MDQPSFLSLLTDCGLGFLADADAHKVDVAELAPGAALMRHGERRWTPSIYCVARGSLIVERDGKQLEVPKGGLLARLGQHELGDSTWSRSKREPVEYSAHAGSEGAVVVEHEDYRSFRQCVLDDPDGFSKLRTLQARLLGSDGDPFVKFLKRTQAHVFGPVEHWPEPFAAELQLYDRNQPIFKKDHAPRGLFIVWRNWVRLSDDSLDEERIMAFLPRGAMFGELERPLDGMFIPNMLSAIAGIAPKSLQKHFEDARPAWVLRVPFETLDEIIAQNPGTAARLHDQLRLRFAAWWPTLIGAAKTTTVDAPLAAAIIRHIYEGRLAKLNRSWPPEQDPVLGSLPEEVEHESLRMDYRLLLMEAAGGDIDKYRLERAEELLQALREKGIIEGDFPSANRTREFWSEPKPIELRVVRPRALLRLAHGERHKDLA